MTTWFGIACFTQPGDFAFENENRVDSSLATAGVANWDFSAVKRTNFGDRAAFEFRADFFNLFNRLQFGYTGTQVGGFGYGTINSQQNSPRVVQLVGKITF